MYTKTPLTKPLCGVAISEDANGNVCLNDLWSLAKAPDNARPADWYRGKRVSNLCVAPAK
jgi:hypothetical protein